MSRLAAKMVSNFFPTIAWLEFILLDDGGICASSQLGDFSEKKCFTRLVFLFSALDRLTTLRLIEIVISFLYTILHRCILELCLLVMTQLHLGYLKSFHWEFSTFHLLTELLLEK